MKNLVKDKKSKLFFLLMKKSLSFLGLSLLVGIIQLFDILILILLPSTLISAITRKINLEDCILLVCAFAIVGLLCNIQALRLNKKKQMKKEYLITYADVLLSDKMMRVDYLLMQTNEFLEKKENAVKGKKCLVESIVSISECIIIALQIFVLSFMLGGLHIALLISIVVVVLVNVGISAKCVMYCTKIAEKMAPIYLKYSYLCDVCFNSIYAKEIRFYKLSDWLSEKYKKLTNDNLNLIKKQAFASSFSQGLSQVTLSVQTAFIYLYIGIKVIAKEISIASFVQYIETVTFITNLFRQLVSKVVDMRGKWIFINHYLELLTIEEECDNSIGRAIPTSREVCVQFADVWFKYPKQDEYVLKGINLEMRQGERIAVVGRNGAGKTTLIKLLLRLYRPTKGYITLNGIDIEDYDLQEYYKLIAVLFQDFAIMSFSIADNILMNQMNEDDIGENSEEVETKIIKALKMAELFEEIQRFDDTIYTMVTKEFSETGQELSGGMKQRTGLARVFYKDASITIFDEPTAALDAKQEYFFYSNVQAKLYDKLSIFITHRLSSTLLSDRIAVIDNGIIAEYGTHDELMKKEGIYKLLFTTQAQMYNQ